MGGSKGSSPVHYKHRPTAPIIYQTVQSQGGWDAADAFIKQLKTDRQSIIDRQALIVGTPAEQAARQKTYLGEQKARAALANQITPDNPIWSTEQAKRVPVSLADSAWDLANQQAVEKKSKEDTKRQATKLAGLALQKGSGYEPPKPS
jgi:hypothetical protein